MLNHQYPNLKVIEERELEDSGRYGFNNVVVAKIPPPAVHQLTYQHIVDAVQQQFLIDLSIEDICKFGTDYFIKTPNALAATNLLTQSFLRILSYTVTFIPWNPYYGAIIVPCRTQTNLNTTHNLSHNNSNTSFRREYLSIEISGIPPHLCCDLAVHRLLGGICTIHSISLEPSTLVYTVNVHGSDTLVPNAAHIALATTTSHGDLLNIWPVWYDTYTREMLGSPSPPAGNHMPSLHGGIHLLIHSVTKTRKLSQQKKRLASCYILLTCTSLLPGDTDLDTELRREAYTYEGTYTAPENNC